MGMYTPEQMRRFRIVHLHDPAASRTVGHPVAACGEYTDKGLLPVHMVSRTTFVDNMCGDGNTDHQICPGCKTQVRLNESEWRRHDGASMCGKAR